MATVFDLKCMRLALDLAEREKGFVAPNPVVGCVITKNGKIISTGSHKNFGGNHAEVNALLKAGKKAKGAVLYSTLEPCDHWGKTPPCAKAIISAGIVKVFAAMKDPNPLVSGRGIVELKKANVKIELGLLEKEAKKLNEDYSYYIQKKLPYVILKIAVTSNGMISWGNGKRKQISSNVSQKMAYELRGKYCAVLVGIGTVLKDNPSLTSHSAKLSNPFRIVVDSKLKIPLNSKVFGKDGKLILACTKKASKKKMQSAIEKGAIVLVLNEKDGEVDLKELLKFLGKMQFSSILVEGGMKILTTLLSEKLVNKMLLFVSPKIVENGKLFVDEKIVKEISLKNCSVKKIGIDTLIEGYF